MICNFDPKGWGGLVHVYYKTVGCKQSTTKTRLISVDVCVSFKKMNPNQFSRLDLKMSDDNIDKYMCCESMREYRYIIPKL